MENPILQSIACIIFLAFILAITADIISKK